MIFHIEDSELLHRGFLIDRHTLAQILRHLASNAVKFSESGTITLRAGVEVGSDGSLFFEIEDQGPGISVSQQSRIFEPFTQIDSSATRRHNGVGLGLAICRDLAEQIGGRIELHSDPGVGSCFHVIFPARAAESAIEASSDHEGRPLEAVRVLVVDDNEGNRQMFGLMLAALGADVSMAENGQAAVDMCQANFFDVVLMDIHMPVLDGLGALRGIRGGQGANADTPVIAFTAGEGGGDRRSLADFDGVVRKPFQTTSLVKAIYAAFSGAPQSVDGVAGLG